MPRTESPASRRPLRPVRLLASVVLVGVAAFYLLTEHLQHTLGALPWLILLMCPLMHMFMHGGHNHGGGPGHGGDGASDATHHAPPAHHHEEP
mgnify:CR=1 FL=1